MPVIGNQTAFPNIMRLGNLARTNWAELLEPGIPVRIGVWIYARNAVVPWKLRAGVYRYTSEKVPDALVAWTEEKEISPGFTGLVTLEIIGANVSELPVSRWHLMVNAYELSGTGIDSEIQIYRAGYYPAENLGAYCWWGIPPMPDPFGYAADYLGQPHQEVVYGQGNPLSLYLEYTPTGAPPPTVPREDTIYWTRAELAEHQASIANKQAIYNNIVAWANARINDPSPAQPGDVNTAMDVGDLIRRYFETMAFLYWVTGDSRYAEAARRWMLSICTWTGWYPHWQPQSWMSIAFAIAYDAFHEYLTPAELQTVRFTIVNNAGSLYNNYSGRLWFAENYPNHKALVASGVGLCALALADDYASSPDWLSFAITHTEIALGRIGQDGGYFEGAAYATYAMDGLIPFLDALRRRTGQDLAASYSDRLRELAYYPIYINYNTRPLQMEDCTGTQVWLRHNRSELSFMYWLASKYNNGYAQTFANTMADQSVIQTYLWKNVNIAPLPIELLPLVRHFRGIGYVIYRSGWGNGDLLIVFKAGSSEGHAHNDQNSWTMYQNGKLVSGGPGYVTSWGEYDQTWCANCILSDGLGQAHEPGDLGTAPLGTRGVIQAVEETGKYLYARGDASAPYTNNQHENIYLRSGDLDKWLRHLVIMKEHNYLVLFDDVEASSPKEFEWLLQGTNFDQETINLSLNGKTITLIKSGGAVSGTVRLDAVVLEPEGFQYEILDAGQGWYASKLWKYIRLHSPAANSARFLSVLFPGRSVLPIDKVSAGNALGVIVHTDATHIDLILFSVDGLPVNQYIELGGYYQAADGGDYYFEKTGVRALFSAPYQVMRLQTATVPQFTLTLAAQAGGTTDPAPGTRSYDAGTVVTVTALPSAGYQFVEWLENNEPVSTNNPVNILMDADRSLVATFEQIVVPPEERIVTVTVLGKGTTDPAPGTYRVPVDSLFTITASPAAGYKFDRWEGDISAKTQTVTFQVSNNMSVIAVFVEVMAPPFPEALWTLLPFFPWEGPPLPRFTELTWEKIGVPLPM